MADVYEVPLGQSNHIRRHATAYGAAWTAYVQPMVQALADAAEDDVTLERVYTEGGGDNGKPMYTGTGCAFDNTVTAIGGDDFAGADATWEAFVRPPDALDATNFPDWTLWPLSDRGDAIITYLTALDSGVKSAASYIYVKHSEYDAQGFSLQPWSRRDYRILEYAHRRFVTEVRDALGKTAAELPALYSVPIPFSNATNDGQNACMRAFEALVADKTFNAKFVVWQTMDCTWNGDGGGPTEYQSHGSNADIWLLARRSALGIANVMGAGWSANNIVSAWRGPKIVHVQWVDALTLDVFLEHNGGADLTLPTSTAAGWHVEHAGVAVTVSSVAKKNARTLTLTLATEAPIAAATRVFYNWGNSRTLPGGAVYDDASTWDSKSYPATITGDNRLNGALCRTGWKGVVASTAAPAAYQLLPVAA